MSLISAESTIMHSSLGKTYEKSGRKLIQLQLLTPPVMLGMVAGLPCPSSAKPLIHHPPSNRKEQQLKMTTVKPFQRRGLFWRTCWIDNHHHLRPLERLCSFLACEATCHITCSLIPNWIGHCNAPWGIWKLPSLYLVVDVDSEVKWNINFIRIKDVDNYKEL